MAETIKCPKCGTEIELTDALRRKLEAQLESQRQALKQQEKELEARQKTVDEQVAEQVKTERKKIAEQEKELEARQKTVDEQVAEQLKTERKKIAEQEKAKILAEQSEQTEALEAELKEKRQMLSEANRKELELRKQQQKLEDEKATSELTVQRAMDKERKKIAEQASKLATEQEQLKLREKDDQLESLTNQIAELKRRAEVGSQQAAGEALEVSLQDILQQTFSFDRFEEIKKGQRGADILQRVRNTAGKLCGAILWESKNTKDFNKAWIPKLRKDQQDARADIAVIVSVALPKEIENFGRQDDIWISDFKSVVGLATVLRQLLIDVTRQKLVSAGQATMKDSIYEYVTGPEFAMHIKAVVSAFAVMQQELEKEKRAVTLIWKKREKQISTVLTNVAGMKGSIEGLAQKALPEAEVLSLEAVANEEDEN